jgi:phage recombination protein Bet
MVAAMTRPSLNADQVDQFETLCREYDLSPFTRQIYPQLRDGRIIPMVGIDGLRAKAARNPRFLGITAPQWAGDDGEWCDVWPANKTPVAARVGVWMRDCPEPTWGVVHFDEYAQTNPMWKKMPRNQSAKCAEAIALRKACPEVSGLYEPVEIADTSKADAPTTDAPSRSAVLGGIMGHMERVTGMKRSDDGFGARCVEVARSLGVEGRVSELPNPALVSLLDSLSVVESGLWSE